MVFIHIVYGVFAVVFMYFLVFDVKHCILVYVLIILYTSIIILFTPFG